MLRIKLLILAMFCLSAYAQLPPMLPVTVGSGIPTGNTFIFVDSASARPNTANQDSVWTPARNYTNSTVLFVTVVDYPSPTPGTNSILSDNKGNTYVNVFSPTVGTSNQRIRYYKCFNPNLSGGNVILTYHTISNVISYPCIYVQGYRGVTTDPLHITNSNSTTSSVTSISTNSITTTKANSLVIATIGVGALVTSAPTVTGSVTASERMNWFPLISNTTTFNASYNSIKTATGTYSVTFTTSNQNFSSQVLAAIIAFE